MDPIKPIAPGFKPADLRKLPELACTAPPRLPPPSNTSTSTAISKKTDPLNKVVFIQKVAAFASRSASAMLRLNYVNESWADTIQNYAFHLFEQRARAECSTTCRNLVNLALDWDIMWVINAFSSKYFLERINCLWALCDSSGVSLEITRLILDNIVRIADSDTIKAQLSVTDKEGCNCLMLICKKQCLFPEVIELIFDAVADVVGREFFKTVLAAKNKEGNNCMHLCCNPWSGFWTEIFQYLAVTRVILDKISEIGGPRLLKAQLTATNRAGQNCVIITTLDERSILEPHLIHEQLKLILDKSLEVGGPELVKSQLAVTDVCRYSCLMHLCCITVAAEEMKLILDYILIGGGPEFLKGLLSATDSDTGHTCLMFLCGNRELHERGYVVNLTVKLFLEKIVEAGGPDFLKSQMVATDWESGLGPSISLLGNQHASAELLLLVASLLHRFGLFKQEYTKLCQYKVRTQHLKEKADINDISWTPNPASIAEVERLLDRGTKKNSTAT